MRQPIEPEAKTWNESICVSLKRIADVLEKLLAEIAKLKIEDDAL